MSGGSAFATSAPTFSGYVWPNESHQVYQMMFQATLRISAGSYVTAARWSWNPTITVTTGTVAAQGLPVGLRIEPASLSVKDQGPGPTDHHHYVLPSGPSTLTGILGSNGRLAVSRFTWPTVYTLLVGFNLSSVLKVLISNDLMSLVPPIPKAGWTAGRRVSVPFRICGPLTVIVNRNPLALAHVTIMPTVGEQEMLPTVGDHHWHVTTSTTLTHPLSATLAVTNTTKHQTRTTDLMITFASRTQDLLNGKQGGGLDRERSTGTLRLRTSTPSVPPSVPSVYTLTYALTLAPS